MRLFALFKQTKSLQSSMLFKRKMAQFSVSPKNSAFSEPVKVNIKGLQSLQAVTLYTQAKLDSGIVFVSIAHYHADADGCIDLAKDDAKGGTFTGCEDMGFIWAMEAHPDNKQQYPRFLQADVENPIDIKLELHEGHFTDIKPINHSNPCITDTTLTKYIKHPKVTRQALTGDVKGAIFVPEGEGPFPALITLYGATAFQIETRAALLASRGILTLALAFFGKPGLPKSFDKFDLKYGEKAVEILKNHPKVYSKNGVGVTGSSMGGVIAQAMGAELKNIGCVLPVNCPVYTDQVGIYNGEKCVIPIIPNKPVVSEGFDTSKTTWGYFIQPSSPFEIDAIKYTTDFYKRKDVSYSFHYSEDDCNCPGPMYAKHAKVLLDSTGHKRYQIHCYPGAGHCLEPPYFPLFSKSYTAWAGAILPFGGTPKPHHEAQIKSWESMISFVKDNLMLASKL